MVHCRVITQRLRSLRAGRRSWAPSRFRTALIAGTIAAALAAGAAALRLAPISAGPLPPETSRLQQTDEPLGVAGVVELIRSDSATGAVVDAAAYELLGEQSVFDWREGRSPGGTTSGVGVVAFPSLRKATSASALTTHIVITNPVARPGFTDFVIWLYDQNGLFDYVCEKLNEKQTEYINLLTWGYVNPGFRGHAVASAWFWDHEVYDAEGDLVRNLVGIAGAAFEQPHTLEPGQSVAVRALPLYPELSLELMIHAHRAPVCSSPPFLPSPTPSVGPPPTITLTPTPSSTPTPTLTPMVPPRYALTSPEVYLPALADRAPYDVCRPTINLQNLGPDCAIAALVIWGGGGSCGEEAGPIAVECSGVLREGGSWYFTPDQIPTNARSAAIYSFNVDPWHLAAERNPAPGAPSDDVIGGIMCETLHFGTVGDPEDFAKFKKAYAAGWEFAGIDQETAWGPPLAVTVERTCTGSEGPTYGAQASYTGVSGPLMGSPAQHGGAFTYALPMMRTATSRSFVAHLQNSGNECAEIVLYARDEASDGVSEECYAGQIAPGEAISLMAADCPGRIPGASGYITSSEPLAIVVDAYSPGSQVSYTAPPLELRELSGAPLVADGSEVGYAPLVYKNFLGWSSRLHVQNTGPTTVTLKATFLDRSGDAVSVRQFGSVGPGGGVAIDVETVGGIPYYWVGGARIEAFSDPAEAGATPWVPEPTSTQARPVPPTWTPWCPGGTETARPTWETPMPTATPLSTETPVRAHTVYLPHTANERR